MRPLHDTFTSKNI